MKYVSFDELLVLHDKVLELSGGSSGVRDYGRLESAVHSQYQEIFGEQLYKGIHEKAAALARGIIGDHPFIDGNKRTAMLTALTLMRINKYKLVASQKDLEDFAVQIAVENCSVEDIAAWFMKNTKEM